MGSAKFSNRDGVRIKYEARGSGAPLALVMGFSASGRSWGEPFIKALEPYFRLILIDNRGTGESDKPDQPYTIRDMAADAAAVLETEGLARVHLMGISMGGMIAQEFALNFPMKLHALVLGCTTFGGNRAIMGAPEVLSQLMPQEGLSPREQARRSLIVCSSKTFGSSKAGLDFIEARMQEVEGYPVTPPHSFARQMEAISGFDTYDRLPRIACPTLVITGNEDPIVPHRNSEILQERIPGAQLQLINGAGHLFFWEAPAESAKKVRNFLESAGK